LFPGNRGRGGSGGNSTNKPPNKKRRYPIWARVLTGFFLFLILIVGSVLAYYQVNLSGVVNNITNQQVKRSAGEEDPNQGRTGDILSGPRINILLLGSDNDNKYSFPALLTQVMMVVHVDPDNKSVYMVSIPRDSWVYVPVNGAMHKIDQAFFFGAAQHNNFDDGVRSARQTIEQDYGLTIDRYAWVGLSGFASVIDTLGGVDIDVTHPIVDDAYPDDTRANSNDPYAVERLYIAPGPHHLNGLEALEYVRSRHADLVGDIGRTNRQQEILEELKKKLTVPNIISHFQQLIADLSGKIYTDLSAQEMLAFANFGRALPSSAIRRVTLGPGSGNHDYGNFATVYDPTLNANQSVVIPHCDTIQPLFNSIFGIGICNVTGGL